MPMRHEGRAKLNEECGEVIQVIGKMLQYPDQDTHPDGTGSLRARLFEEMADVAGASEFVMARMKMTDEEAAKFFERRNDKYQLFCAWDEEEGNR